MWYSSTDSRRAERIYPSIAATCAAVLSAQCGQAVTAFEARHDAALRVTRGKFDERAK